MYSCCNTACANCNCNICVKQTALWKIILILCLYRMLSRLNTWILTSRDKGWPPFYNISVTFIFVMPPVTSIYNHTTKYINKLAIYQKKWKKRLLWTARLWLECVADSAHLLSEMDQITAYQVYHSIFQEDDRSIWLQIHRIWLIYCRWITTKDKKVIKTSRTWAVANLMTWGEDEPSMELHVGTTL